MQEDQEKIKKSSTNKFKKRRSNIIIFIISWVCTLVLGGVICFLCVLISWGLLNNGFVETSSDLLAKNYVIYGLISMFFLAIIFVITRKLIRFRFLKYMSWALVVGIAINFIIFVISATNLINNFLAVSSINGQAANKCSSLELQLDTARSATYPIATDLGSGTAFAIDQRGTLLTAYHVVEGATSVYVNVSSGAIPLTVIETAPEYDLALLKMDQVTPYYMNMTNNYSVGNNIFVIGYPGNTLTAGYASVSSGIVSRILSKDSLELNITEGGIDDGLELVQTDAPINPGNSGGAVFNKCGVVGVVSFRSNLGGYEIVSEQGISYIVSSKTISSRFSLPIYNK